MSAGVRLKIEKAEEFLTAANFCLEIDAYDAATSLAVSAAINASDALILAAGQAIPTDHSSAVTVVRRLGHENASVQLRRALSFKNKAQYDIARCTAGNAEDAIKYADRIIGKAKEGIK